MSWVTGAFEPEPEYVAKVLFGTGEEEEMSEVAFIEEVESWRARNLTGTGEVHELYTQVNAIEDQAQREDRALTAEERATIRELRTRSYALFEEPPR